MLDAAGPVLPGGKRDSADMARREQAMVKNALAAGLVAVIICSILAEEGKPVAIPHLTHDLHPGQRALKKTYDAE